MQYKCYGVGGIAKLKLKNHIGLLDFDLVLFIPVDVPNPRREIVRRLKILYGENSYIRIKTFESSPSTFGVN